MAWQGSCPRCSATIDADSRTCPACGADLRGQVVLLSEGGGPARLAPATVVTSGAGRRPAHGLGLLAAAVVAVVAVLAVLGGGGGGDEAAPPTTAPGGPAQEPAGEDPSGAPGGRGVVEAGDGPLLAGEDPPVLLVDDGSFATVELATGRVSHPGTGVAVDISSPVMARDGAVVVIDRRGVVQALTADLSTRLAEFGAAEPLASGRPDAVWLTTVVREAGGGLVVEERAVTGQLLRGPFDLLPGVAPVGSLSTGVLLQTPAGIYLIDGPAPRRVAGGQYLGAAGQVIVRYDCEEPLACAVHLTDVSAGTDTVPSLPGTVLQTDRPAGLIPGAAAVSPDGRLAAIACACPDGEGLAIVETATGDVLHQVIGIENPMWSLDGRWLFATNAGVVYAWRAGAGDVAPIDVTLRGARLVAVLPHFVS